MPVQKGIKPVAQNRKARHDYFIEDTYECGIELVGTEVKSIRAGKVNLKDCYAQVKDGQMYVIGMHISPMSKVTSTTGTLSAAVGCCSISGRSASSRPCPRRTL